MMLLLRLYAAFFVSFFAYHVLSAPTCAEQPGAAASSQPGAKAAAAKGCSAPKGPGASR